MNKRTLAGLLVVAGLGAAGCGGRTEPDRAAAGPGAPAASVARRSVLLVSLDTTRADRLGCYGYAHGATPTIDRWAAAGVVFDDAATPAPVTLPAHASLMTGLLPNRHGARDNGLYRVPDDVTTLAETLAAAGYDTAAVVGAGVLDRQYGLAQGFARYDDDVQGGGLTIPERRAGTVTDAALATAAQLRAPFFLFVHYFDPHAAYQPPPPFSETFRDRPYDGEIAYVDQELGRLRAGLDRRGLLEGTIVALVADHGESLGEHGEPAHGVFLYQPTVRIPWILVAPGLPAGARRGSLARLVDVAPTLLELAGVAAPAGIDGRSLAAIAQGTAPDATGPALPLETELGYNSYGFAPLRGLFDGRAKWIGAPRDELYDVAADPGEQRNLARERAAEVDRLRAAWRAAVTEDRVAGPPGGGSPQEAARRAAELSSLGYVSASARGSATGRALPDAKDAIGTLQDITDARAALAAGRQADAERLLARVIERTPQNLSALILLGSARIESGRPVEAIAPLERAAQLAPDNTDVQFNLGIARLGTGDTAGAERAWRETLRLAPRYHDAVVNLVDLLQGTGRAPEAAAVLREARALGLSSGVLDYLEGRLAVQRGEILAARDALQRALARPLPPGIAHDARAMLARLGR
ncbi:MAG: sulfatase-like hydrolase/transferase [Acidobacteria bacterium]|nr:sulfatase-like hydrolase/transferase [Acidobacteriota bacterium]